MTTRKVVIDLSDREPDTAGGPPGPPGEPGGAAGLEPGADAVLHEVSDPLASSWASLVVPAAHAVHTLDLTYWFTAQRVPSHRVSDPLESSPAAFVVDVRTVVAAPPTFTAKRPHFTHLLSETNSLAAQ